MENIFRINTTIAILFLLPVMAFAQKAYYFGPDAFVNMNDSVVIRLNDYEGNIQWQKSFDLDVWENISGATNDTLLFLADTTTYFRAEVIAGFCDPFYSDTVQVGVYKLNSAVVIIDDYDVVLLSDSTQLANGIYIYSGDLTGIIDIGSVLVSSEGEGYIRVVTEVNPQKNETIFFTEGGSLIDVIDFIDIQDYILITMSDSEKDYPNAREIPLQISYLIPGAKTDHDNNGFNLTGVDFNIEISDPDDEAVTRIISATIKHGNILFEPRFERTLKIDNIPPQVDLFGFKALGEIDYELDVIVEAEIDISVIDVEKHLVTYTIGPVYFSTVPVPMYIDYTLTGVFSTAFDESGEVSFGFKSGYETQFGALYNSNTNPQWTTIWQAVNKPFTDEYLNSNVHSNIFASVGIETQFSTRIGDVSGPDLIAEPALWSDFRISSAPPQWNSLLTMGISGKLNFDVAVIDETINDFHTNLFPLSWDIHEDSTPIEGPLPVLETLPVIDISDTYAQTGGNIIYQGETPVTARGVVWSESAPALDFNEIDLAFISDFPLTDDLINGSDNEDNQLTPGTIILYKTNENKFGKFRVLNYGWALTLEWVTYNEDGSVFSSGDNLIISSTGSCDLDAGVQSILGDESDFFWTMHTEVIRYLEPVNGALFGIYDINGDGPTIEDNDGFTIDGEGEGEFISNITGLIPETEYNVRAYATNSAGTTYGALLSFTTQTFSEFVCGISFVTDINGNVYNTVLIGDQCWIKENLRTTKYNNGDNIPLALSNTDWQNSTSGAYAIYPHNNIDGLYSDAEVVSAYGKLYNWFAAVDPRGICPSGWSVPEDADWTQLVDYVVAQGHLNHFDVLNGAGNALKSCRQVDSPLENDCNTSVHPRWNSDFAHHGFDEFGFSSLPGGGRWSDGSFLFIGFSGHWHSSSEYSSTNAWYRAIISGEGSVSRSNHSKRQGYSVRCIRDMMPEPTTYNLYLEVEPSGAGSVIGTGVYEEGEVVNIIAIPEEGWEFLNWTGDVEHIDDANSASTTVTMPAADVTLTANFEEENGSDETQVVDVLNPATGKTWMDRNLGATRAAISSNDAEAYGHLYQWGRADDGHQVRTSDITSTLSDNDTPGHGYFIIVDYTPYDWRSPQNHNLWQGVNGINNPCPMGYRLPTDAELNAERLSWSSNNTEGAFDSPLKLSLTGSRNYNSGLLNNVGFVGYYWSSTIDGINSSFFFFFSGNATIAVTHRALGASVRCIKDSDQILYDIILQVSPEDSGQVTGTGSYTEGTTVNINATPNTGYIFINWTGDVEHIADANSASTNITMPATDVTLTANFAADEPELYILTLTPNSIAGGTANGSGEYSAGTAVNINAESNPGYYFLNWTGDTEYLADPDNAVTILTMPAQDISLTANFQIQNPNFYSLSLIAHPTFGGSVIGAGAYAAGIQHTITANPNTGFDFVNWTGDTQFLGTPNEATTTLIMPSQNVFLTANFEIISYTITYYLNDGSNHPDNPHEFTIEDLPFILQDAVKEGFTFEGWFDNAQFTGDPVIQITQIGDIELWAKFSQGTEVLNLIRGGPAETNPLAIPVQIVGVSANPYTTNLNQWTGNWQAPQAIYDQGIYVNDPNNWSNILGNSNAGTTWSNSNPGIGYGILVVDLQQLREITNISVFQMFSDGKITHIALAKHPETSNTAPDAFNEDWSEFLPKTVVGAGSNGVSYVYNPTKLFVDAQTRYVKIMAFNDGSHGNPGYIELKGIKMYGGAANTFTLNLEVFPEGSGVVSGEGVYSEGKQVEISANANEGYIFLNWTGDIEHIDNVNSAITNITMPATDVTLTSNFAADEPELYILTLTPNPIAGGTANGSGEYSAGTEVSINAESNPGYYFLNWTGDTEYLADPDDDATTLTMPAKDISLTANFQIQNPNFYSLSLIANPTIGGNVVGAGAYAAGIQHAITANPNAGFDFLNWTGATQFLADPSRATTNLIMPAQNIFLTANFEILSYTITYNLNDGSNHLANPSEFTIENLPFILQDAEKAGFTFEGWFDNAQFTGDPVMQITQIGDIELWAKFDYMTYAITYNLDGGINHEANPHEFIIDNLPINLGDAVKDGYTFEGWYNNAQFTGEPVTQITQFDDLELWAKFEIITYSITYNLDDGVNHAHNPHEFTIKDLPFNLRDAVKDGYSFKGWYNNPQFSGEPVSQISQNRDTELWAKFDVIYYITYNVDGGANDPDNPNEFTLQDLPFILHNAEKVDFSFDGWYDNEQFTGEPITQITQIGDIELWAKFSQITDWPTDTETDVVEILNPETGRIWMDRNLGASRVATSSTDAEAYGQLYQWGRAADGHQLRTSGTTNIQNNSDIPGHSDFIIGSSDWRSPHNDNLWQGLDGINNPCPEGYRIPTEAELTAEGLSWNSSDSEGAFSSPLKLPVGGYRKYQDGILTSVDNTGWYWSGTVNGTGAMSLGFNEESAWTIKRYDRGDGASVRCIRDQVASSYTLSIGIYPEGGETVSKYPEKDEYLEGDIVSIIASSAKEFIYWTGDIEHLSIVNLFHFTFTMPAQDVNFIAHFKGPSVLNNTTKRVWMARNLGASRAATSGTDAEAYGHLFQWGRAADGHQLRTSGTTNIQSNSDIPGHSDFIIGSSDWREPQNDNLWQGLGGINYPPCPSSYRLPTEAELIAEMESWNNSNSAGAFASKLKLSAGGYRKYQDGILTSVDNTGWYWSGTVNGTGVMSLGFNEESAGSIKRDNRGDGASVRCIRDKEATFHTLNINIISPEGCGEVKVHPNKEEYFDGELVNLSAIGNEDCTFLHWNGDTDYISTTDSENTILTMPAQDITLTVYFVEGNGDDNQVEEVFNPATGKTWMDRNLGANRVATSSTDEEAYGDLFQWGRRADGHQKRTSGTTVILSDSDTPGHGDFILATTTPYDWRSPQNTNLWQGENGINNPCPSGFRLPTAAEWNAERMSWPIHNAAGAFASPLKLPAAGSRNYNNGLLHNVGSSGNYWSANVKVGSYNTWSHYLWFGAINAIVDIRIRGYGHSVRCIKHEDALLTLQIVPEGAGQVTGEGIYSDGSVVTITATPNANYKFIYWTGDDDHIIGDNTAITALNMPWHDMSLTANFAEIVDVINPATGKIWMDRNLGALDVGHAGALYQWGRLKDGHQVRTSNTTTTLSSFNDPGHGRFIVANDEPVDWRSPQNDNLWQGVNGTNNPCPIGYRVPTEVEFNDERLTWDRNDSNGAWESVLKLPIRSGYRNNTGGVTPAFLDRTRYWTSTVSNSKSRYFNLSSGSEGFSSEERAFGHSVRCIKE